MRKRVAGTLFFLIDGKQHNVKAGLSYNIGAPKREGILNAGGGVPGYKETPQIPFVEGEVTDTGDLNLREFLELDGVTVTLELANGKRIVFRNAWQAGEGNVGTDDANIAFRLEAESAEEVA